MKHWPFLLIALTLALAVAASPGNAEFRGKWWHYYERGREYAGNGEWDKALGDLKQAGSMREKDQRMARTYGMHFIDYFPHRELGIVYLGMGRIDEAAAELEQSIRQEESAKAAYFLNKARRALLMRQGGKAEPPAITISSPAPDAATNETHIRIKGKVAGNGYISRIVVNNAGIGMDLARQEIEFEKEVNLDEADNRILITAEDLLGNITTRSVTVRVDTEGPLISIFNVVTHEKGGKKFVRITGEVTDATGIRSVTVGGRTVEIRNERAFSLDMEQEWGAANRLTIRAWDCLDNPTTAELDLERDLAVFDRRGDRVLLAFNSPRIFSSDRENPVITLKDSKDLPTVFVDRYYVDGEVADNGRVERILVNNRELPVKKGRKIFFGKLVNLNEGKNSISVTAFDSSGNSAAAGFTVTRRVPEVMANGSRMSLSLMPFGGTARDAGYVRLANDFLMGSLVEQRRFMVIEREKLLLVLAEQRLSQEKLTDPEHSIRLGRLVAADAIVATTLKEEKKSMEIVARVIDTETSEVLAVKDVFSEDKGRAGAKELMEGLAAKLARGFPLSEGVVVKVAGSDVHADMGGTQLRKGAGVIVYKNGPEVRHPITGRSLGRDTIRLADGRIEEVLQGKAKVKLLDRFRKQAIKASDLIITK